MTNAVPFTPSGVIGSHYSGVGADIVMESITLIVPKRDSPPNAPGGALDPWIVSRLATVAAPSRAKPRNGIWSFPHKKLHKTAPFSCHIARLSRNEQQHAALSHTFRKTA